MALTTVSAVKTALGLAVSDTSQDAVLAQLVSGVDAAIKKAIGRDIEQQTYTEFYSGDGSSLLCLNQYPVMSITSIHEDPQGCFGFGTDAFATATMLTAGTDYALMRTSAAKGAESGIVRRIGQGWPRPSSQLNGMLSSVPGADIGNIRVVYVAGFSVVPADLSMAAMQLVSRMKSSLKVGGPVQQMSYEDASVSFFNSADGVAVMGSIESTLKNYRRYAV